MSRAPAADPVRVVVDDREGRCGLADALALRWPHVAVGRLPAGDVEIGARVLVERKTVGDFVLSIEDGRLFRQAYGLSAACERPLLVVEGEDVIDAARLAPTALRGVLLALAAGYRLPMLRTCSVDETADLLAHLATRESRRSAAAPVAAGPRPARVAMDLLCSIPGIGDERARRLLERFGSVRGVLDADPEDVAETPGVGPRTAEAVRNAFGGG